MRDERPSRRSEGSRLSSGLTPRAALGALVLALAGFVAPPDHVLAELTRSRRRVPPVTLELEVRGPGQEVGRKAWVELHPGGAWRITDEGGGSWTGSGSVIRDGSSEDPPEGLAEAWLIWVSDRDALEGHLARQGVDLGRNELGRCGDEDCWVLGGRSGAAQLWIDKDRLEVRRLRNRRGRVFEFEGYREGLEGVRVPSLIRVLDSLGVVAEAEVRKVDASPHLRDLPEPSPARPR